MTIEQAIKSLENIIEYWGCRPTEQKAAELALTALQEKQEREKGCEYCKVLTPDVATGFALPSIYPDCEFDLVTIAHCPMCGRKLGEWNG